METNHRVIKKTPSTMCTMVEKLDKNQQKTIMMDLDFDKETSRVNDFSFKLTRENLKRKVDPNHHELLEVKKTAHEMCKLEAEVAETLKKLASCL